MNRPTLRPVAACAGFVATIVVANIATSRYGMVPVGFGLLATAGTYFAGASFVARDAVQDVGGRRLVLITLAVGAALSLWMSAPAIAVASAAAFLLSELVDLAIYTPLRARGYIRAALASNIVGSVVDSLVFLSLAHFPVGPSLPGQLLGKFWITALVVATVAIARALMARRQAVSA